MNPTSGHRRRGADMSVSTDLSAYGLAVALLSPPCRRLCNRRPAVVALNLQGHVSETAVRSLRCAAPRGVRPRWCPATARPVGDCPARPRTPTRPARSRHGRGRAAGWRVCSAMAAAPRRPNTADTVVAAGRSRPRLAYRTPVCRPTPLLLGVARGPARQQRHQVARLPVLPAAVVDASGLPWGGRNHERCTRCLRHEKRLDRAGRPGDRRLPAPVRCHSHGRVGDQVHDRVDHYDLVVLGGALYSGRWHSSVTAVSWRRGRWRCSAWARGRTLSKPGNGLWPSWIVPWPHRDHGVRRGRFPEEA